MQKKILNCTILLCLLWTVSVQACSTFCLNKGDELVFGRNFDWMVGEGLVIVNKSGMEKTALVNENAAHWTSKYGSVTFNLYGREFPMDGVNEAGLVVACLWLEEATYPEPDDRACLNDLQWVQYQLDNFSTVEEVINSNSIIRITPGSVPLHFLVCDGGGACATVEFLDNEMVYDYMAGPYKALTNDIYKSSVDYFTSNGTMFDNDNILMSYEDSVENLSLAAFSILMNKLNEYDSERHESAVDFAFNVLKKVKYGDFSKWSIVYDLTKMKVYYFTSGSEDVKFIDLKLLDFSSSSPVLMIDINERAEGSVTERLVEYTTETNRALIEIAYSRTPFLKDTPDEILDLIAEYPESIKATE